MFMSRQWGGGQLRRSDQADSVLPARLVRRCRENSRPLGVEGHFTDLAFMANQSVCAYPGHAVVHACGAVSAGTDKLGAR